jgi:hypothetical protein
LTDAESHAPLELFFSLLGGSIPPTDSDDMRRAVLKGPTKNV